jgi:hypothetical protein
VHLVCGCYDFANVFGAVIAIGTPLSSRIPLTLTRFAQRFGRWTNSLGYPKAGRER